jgi:hypothetical protein
MLFKQTQEAQQFSIDELFKEHAVSVNLFTIPLPECLTLTPADIYNRIKQIAANRFRYTALPERQHDLLSLAHSSTKIAILRDLCIKIGIKIRCQISEEYILDNDLAVL